MNSYEIKIHNMKNNMEMSAIQEALWNTGITDAGFAEVGKYLQFDKPRSVFVDPSEVSKAVEVLNGLGYQTDEDEIEAE